MFDRVTGRTRTLSEIIDIDVTRRYLLLIGDDALWLVVGETGSFEALKGAGNGNACLAPRQASFSTKGKRVAWVTDKAGSLTVRDLATGAAWRIAAKQRMWRGWPQDDGRGAVVIEVPAGTIEQVSEDGSRSKGEAPGSEGVWPGKTTAGCELEPQSNDDGLERGPWQWQCP